MTKLEEIRAAIKETETDQDRTVWLWNQAQTKREYQVLEYNYQQQETRGNTLRRKELFLLMLSYHLKELKKLRTEQEAAEALDTEINATRWNILLNLDQQISRTERRINKEEVIKL